MVHLRGLLGGEGNVKCSPEQKYNLYIGEVNMKDVVIKHSVRLCVFYKGTSLVASRRLSHPAAKIFAMMAHCNNFLNALIYISQYDAVRLPLIGFLRRIRARHQPHATN